MTTSSLLNPAYKDWLESKTNPYETIILLEKSEVSNVDLSDISDALEEYVRLFTAEIASPAEILTLSRAYPDEEKYSLAVIDKELDQNEPVVIGGPASVEVVDREGHLITVAAMKRAFDRFMANFRTRNAMVLHSDVQVGWALPAYISKTGKIYKSGVTGDHLFFITELRDDTKIAKKVLEQIETGKMKSYSIAGSATSVEPTKKEDGGVIMQVNDMELAEVTICEQGVNQRAKFELMKADGNRPTSSCVDGSCLIKSQEHKHSETELFMDKDGVIDTVGSFINWLQKEPMNDPEDKPKKLARLLSPPVPTDEGDEDAAAKNRARVAAGKNEPKATQYSSYTPSERSTRRRERIAEEETDAPSGNQILEGMQKQLEDKLFVDTDVEAGKAERKAGERDKKVKSRGVKFPMRPANPDRGYFVGGSLKRGKAYPKVENMQKSHLEGCLCEECKQRTGDTNGDDTPRLATDTQGRPTLGHAGHGNVVAILVSRMHRKARSDRNIKWGPSGPGLGGRPMSNLKRIEQGEQRDKGEDEQYKRKYGTPPPSGMGTSTRRKAIREEPTSQPSELSSKLPKAVAATAERKESVARRARNHPKLSDMPGYKPDFRSLSKAVYAYIHKQAGDPKPPPPPHRVRGHGHGHQIQKRQKI